jgi:hypothetical protein
MKSEWNCQRPPEAPSNCPNWRIAQIEDLIAAIAAADADDFATEDEMDQVFKRLSGKSL